MTDSLVARLREAIDETERIAQAAVGFDYGVKDWADDGDPVNVHIARHDPAAAERQCAAYRRILDLHDTINPDTCTDPVDRAYESGVQYGLRMAIRRIAAAYEVAP